MLHCDWMSAQSAWVAGFQRISRQRAACTRVGLRSQPRQVAKLDIAHQIGLGTVLCVAAHHGALDAHGTLAEVDVRPAQRNLLGRTEAGEERRGEVVHELRILALAEASRDRFNFGARKRWLVSRPPGLRSAGFRPYWLDRSIPFSGPKVQERVWTAMMFCALGVFAVGILVIAADVGFFSSKSGMAPQHVFLTFRLFVTAVIALPLSVWLFFHADRFGRVGRIGICAIATVLVPLNLDLATVVFAIAALIASI